MAMAGDKPAVPSARTGTTEPQSARTNVDTFLQRLAATPAAMAGGRRGRLLFALDATASRERAWDQACHIQGEMFGEAAALGGLEIQLAYYRGFLDFHATGWLADAAALVREMTGVTCLSGHTQIARVLDHALAESRGGRVSAVVFVGDAMEEDAAELCAKAGELGVRGVPVFVFEEGNDPTALATFQQIAKLSGGAWCRFDSASAQQLRDLLRAVAVYAAGGRKALLAHGDKVRGDVLLLTRQLK